MREVSTLIEIGMIVLSIQKLDILLLLRKSIIYSPMIGTSNLVSILNVSVDVIGYLVNSRLIFEFSHLREGPIQYQAFEWIFKINPIIKT